MQPNTYSDQWPVTSYQLVAKSRLGEGNETQQLQLPAKSRLGGGNETQHLQLPVTSDQS